MTIFDKLTQQETLTLNFTNKCKLKYQQLKKKIINVCAY